MCTFLFIPSPQSLQCKILVRGTCAETSCDFWYSPVCPNFKSESGCKYGDKCKLLHIEAGGQPSKKPKKGGAQGSVALLKETIQLDCVSQDHVHRKSILRENGNWGSNHTVKFSKTTMRHAKFRKEGPIAGNHSKV